MFHIRSYAPSVVDFPNGQRTLWIATWCGKVVQPDGDDAAHAYDLPPATVTCPTCHHMFTCPAADLDNDLHKEDCCQVCEHLFGCADKACRDNHHPGILPPPATGHQGRS